MNSLVLIKDKNDKGDIIKISDYVQQTFIHLKLQEFIYKCYNKLDNIDNELYCSKYDYDELGNNLNYLSQNEFNTIKSYINNKHRVIKIEPFYNTSASRITCKIVVLCSICSKY